MDIFTGVVLYCFAMIGYAPANVECTIHNADVTHHMPRIYDAADACVRDAAEYMVSDHIFYQFRDGDRFVIACTPWMDMPPGVDNGP